MSIGNQILVLIKKEMVLEWRSKYAIGGIMLYVFSTVFIMYNGFIQIEPHVWNVLFWIVALFISVNALTKSFVSENTQRQLYYYTIAHPLAVIFSKIIYNCILLLILNILCFLVFGLIMGNPVKESGLFFMALTLGSCGLAITFTFISAIANKANNSATLIAILGFPLIIPILVSLIKISASALRLMTDTSVTTDIWTLLIIDVLLLAMTYLLFPFLWRD